MSEFDPRADTPLLDWSDLGVTELLPTGTVTLLLADVEGSTRLWQTQPDEMTAAVLRLDRVLAEAVSSYNGVRPVEQGEGDSFVLAFGCAGDAVACALQLQRSPLAPIRLRIGVHTGDIQLRNEANYVGPTINRTARLRDLAHGGQTVLSGATEALVIDQLPQDVWLKELGTHELRDLPRPERVLQLCHRDLHNEFPPLRTSKSLVAHGLPLQLTSFVGRSAQMAEVRTLLSDNRLVTLTGAGGAGKTRLAVEIASRVAGEFRDGLFYVDLAPITDPELMAVAVTRALGLPDLPGSSTTTTLIRFVGEREMLLVLDNCEHLLDATSLLAIELLAAGPGLRLLATSREPTGVAGEVTFVVPSLSLADEAIELFTDRARRVRPDFGVSDANAASVTEICRRLDGMPLAIELAAARVRALSLEEIVGGLHDRFRLLTGGARTAVRRQQTLRASVDWSHALLTGPEQVLFRRLAVFMGGFDLDAAQTVAGGTELQPYQVLDQLALLVDKSLTVAENTGGRTRYRLLETVRQYAQEKLGESGEADAVRTRHRDYYTSIAALLDAPARDDREQRIELADEEMDNLRSAFAWSRETGDIGTALELTSSLQPLWLSRGRVKEGLNWLETTLADERAADVVQAVLARAYADRAMLLAWAGSTDNMDDVEHALTVARELNDPILLIRALMARGYTSAYDADVARPYFAEAARLARDLGDSWRLSQILGVQTTAATVAGDPVAARASAEEGLEVARAVGDRLTSRQCRFANAWARTCQGDLAGALVQSATLIDQASVERDGMYRVVGLVSQGWAQAYQGDAGGARASGNIALEGCAELPEHYEGVARSVIAVGCLAGGDAPAAWQAYEAVRQHTGLEPRVAGTYIWWALAPLACGDLGEARRWADDAVSVTKGWYLSAALTTRARVEIAHGAFDRAGRDAREALGIATGVAGHLAIPDIFECLAAVVSDAGSHREAARLYGAAQAARQRMGTVRFKVLDAAYEASVAGVRNSLGEEGFAAGWAEGAALSTEEAIAYAQRGRGERGHAKAGWDSLTPTELDVVRLVQEGLSNKDIGVRMFISPRTVQTHLTHVYTKLGLTSRMQLVQEPDRIE